MSSIDTAIETPNPSLLWIIRDGLCLTYDTTAKRIIDKKNLREQWPALIRETFNYEDEHSIPSHDVSIGFDISKGFSAGFLHESKLWLFQGNVCISYEISQDKVELDGLIADAWPKFPRSFVLNGLDAAAVDHHSKKLWLFGHGLFEHKEHVMYATYDLLAPSVPESKRVMDLFQNDEKFNQFAKGINAAAYDTDKRLLWLFSGKEFATYNPEKGKVVTGPEPISPNGWPGLMESLNRETTLPRTKREINYKDYRSSNYRAKEALRKLNKGFERSPLPQNKVGGTVAIIWVATFIAHAAAEHWGWDVSFLGRIIEPIDEAWYAVQNKVLCFIMPSTYRGRLATTLYKELTHERIIHYLNDMENPPWSAALRKVWNVDWYDPGAARWNYFDQKDLEAIQAAYKYAKTRKWLEAELNSLRHSDKWEQLIKTIDFQRHPEIKPAVEKLKESFLDINEMDAAKKIVLENADWEIYVRDFIVEKLKYNAPIPEVHSVSFGISNTECVKARFQADCRDSSGKMTWIINDTEHEGGAIEMDLQPTPDKAMPVLATIASADFKFFYPRGEIELFQIEDWARWREEHSVGRIRFWGQHGIITYRCVGPVADMGGIVIKFEWVQSGRSFSKVLSTGADFVRRIPEHVPVVLTVGKLGRTFWIRNNTGRSDIYIDQPDQPGRGLHLPDNAVEPVTVDYGRSSFYLLYGSESALLSINGITTHYRIEVETEAVFVKGVAVKDNIENSPAGMVLRPGEVKDIAFQDASAAPFITIY